MSVYLFLDFKSPLKDSHFCPRGPHLFWSILLFLCLFRFFTFYSSVFVAMLFKGDGSEKTICLRLPCFALSAVIMFSVMTKHSSKRFLLRNLLWDLFCRSGRCYVRLFDFFFQLYLLIIFIAFFLSYFLHSDFQLSFLSFPYVSLFTLSLRHSYLVYFPSFFSLMNNLMFFIFFFLFIFMLLADISVNSLTLYFCLIQRSEFIFFVFISRFIRILFPLYKFLNLCMTWDFPILSILFIIYVYLYQLCCCLRLFCLVSNLK